MSPLALPLVLQQTYDCVLVARDAVLWLLTDKSGCSYQFRMLVEEGALIDVQAMHPKLKGLKPLQRYLYNPRTRAYSNPHPGGRPTHYIWFYSSAVRPPFPSLQSPIFVITAPQGHRVTDCGKISWADAWWCQVSWHPDNIEQPQRASNKTWVFKDRLGALAWMPALDSLLHCRTNRIIGNRFLHYDGLDLIHPSLPPYELTGQVIWSADRNYKVLRSNSARF